MDTGLFFQMMGLLIALGGVMASFTIMIFRYLLNKRDAESAALRGEISELRKIIAQMPEKYVLREDWVLFSSSITSRLDKLYDLISNKKGGR